MTHTSHRRLGKVLGALAVSIACLTGTATAHAGESTPATMTLPAGDAAVGGAGASVAPTVSQPAPHRGDILVPDWILLFIAAAVIAAAVAVATQSYLRFSQTRNKLEG